ncbi:MAG: UDP-N-acetylmuramate dehydrogenase [Deltaproteobacteria bacterium]|nr:UDP-N-acetylmuramate dehydrogenase [Deltaproteobacteria bacterium]MBI3078867.1 UDP-N-acetylmuramate dehydrogenase [Deltaproteobacteria bacterium]
MALDPVVREELAGLIKGRVLFDHPMRQYTTIKVGGPADAVLFPKDEEDLRHVLEYAARRGLPYFLVGEGANLLVKDKGIRGLVINLSEGFDQIAVRLEGEGGIIEAGAGADLGRMMRVARDHGLTGLEFVAGLPASFGAALAMNAGVHEREMKDITRTVRIMERGGTTTVLPRAALQFQYRFLVLPSGAIIVGGELELGRDDPKAIRERESAYILKRKRTQPLAFPNAGCMFRNPPGDYAGRLIEEAGLKGTRVGGAKISELHANFIVNLGEARAEDVLALMELATEAVYRRTGVRLTPEVKVVGE